jgi:glycosyltransferase involved in cell wall biosynthesis
MRLAVYIRSVKTARGAEQTVATVARGLAARGHDVDLLVEDGEGWLLDDLAKGDPPIRIVRLREPPRAPRVRSRGLQARALVRAFPGARSLAAVRALGALALGDDPPLVALRDYVRRERPASMLSFLNYPNFVLLLVSLLCPGETRFFVNVRNHVSSSSARARSRWNRGIPLLMKTLFRRADGVVTPSRGVADDVLSITGLPPERVTVIYNPVYRPEGIALAGEPVAHPWLQGGDTPVLIGAGKLKPQKDFPTLIRAFARLRRRRPARLVILGEGDARPALEALARELGVEADVDFPGYQQNPWAWLRRASVFVLSSAWEGLPNVLIEAMACGCPVVSTDCPSGPREILDGGRYGPLVPVGDAEAMAAALERVLEAPPPREVLVEAARHFSFEDAIGGYEALLTGRSGGTPGPPREEPGLEGRRADC